MKHTTRLFVLVIVLVGLLLSATTTLAQGQPKLDVCHWDGSQYVRIAIADPAWDAHQEHGDKVVGDGVDENCQPLSAPVSVYMLEGTFAAWVLTLDPSTGGLAGEWRSSGWNWSASGSVTPADPFDSTASPTVTLTVTNPEPTGCYPYADYFTYEGTRLSGNTFSGTWTNWCFSGETAGSGTWEGTLYEGEYSAVADASTLTSVSGGPALSLAQ